MLPAVLRHNRPYARLWTAQSISQFGGQATYLSLPLAAYDSTGSAAIFASTMMASSIGLLLTMLVGGALADRFDRQRMMLTSDAAVFGIVGTLGWAVVAEHWHVVVVMAFLQTTVASLLRSGEALRRDIVDEPDRAQANALSHFALNSTNLVAPLLGAAVYVRFGFAPIVVLDLATTALSFILLTGVRDPRAADRREPLRLAHVTTRVATDIRDGAAIILGDPWMRTSAIGTVFGGMANGSFIVVILPWIDQTLGLPSSAFGATIATVGGAGIVGSLVVGRVAAKLGTVRLIQVGAGMGALACVGFLVPTPVPLIALCLVLFGLSNVAMSVGIMTEQQRRFPGDVQGRLGAMQLVLGQGCGLLGMTIAAALIDRIDPAVMAALFGAGVMASCLIEAGATLVLQRTRVQADDEELALSA